MRATLTCALLLLATSSWARTTIKVVPVRPTPPYSPASTPPLTAIRSSCSQAPTTKTSTSRAKPSRSTTIALSPSTLTLAPGAVGTAAIQLASIGNFAGPLALPYSTSPVPLHPQAISTPTRAPLPSCVFHSGYKFIETCSKNGKSVDTPGAWLATPHLYRSSK